MHYSERETRLVNLRAHLAELLHDHSEITFELGCGHGHFLNAYASEHPGKFCVGIDLIIDRVERADRKRGRAELSNLRFVRADALEFLECLPPVITFTEVFILFPDPWPKRRHHKYRIIQPEFLTSLASRMKTGAQLCFRTDFDPYFADAQATIAAHRDWTLRGDAPWPFEVVTVFQKRASSYQSLVAARGPVL